MPRPSPVSRQVAYVHAFFIGLVCVQFGVLAALGTGQLLAGSPLARGVLIAAALFWAAGSAPSWWSSTIGAECFPIVISQGARACPS